MRVLRTLWRGWIRFAEMLGNVVMSVWLTILYWTLLAVIALPFKLLADPLALRRRDRSWVSRDAETDVLGWMRRQG